MSTGRIKFANRRMREITGHDQLENRNIYDLLDQDNQELLRGGHSSEPDEQCGAAGIGYHVQEPGTGLGHHEFGAACSKRAILWALLLCSVISRPCGKRKSDSAKSLKKRPSACPWWIWNGRILDVNPAFLKMLGYKKHEVVRKSFQGLPLSGRRSEEHQAVPRTGRRGNAIPTPGRIVTCIRITGWSGDR